MNFYSMRLKRLNDAKKIIKKIDFLFENSYLLTILNKYVVAAINGHGMDIDYSNDSELIIRDKATDDCFHLTISGDMNINIHISTSNEEIKLKINWEKDEDRISCCKEIKVSHKTKYLGEKTIEKRTYINNDLRYLYTYLAVEDLSHDFEDIMVSETYIDLNKSAVNQNMRLTGKAGKPKQVEMKYLETECYSAQPFNDLVNHNSYLSKELIPSSKENFYEFVNGSNNLSPIL